MPFINPFRKKTCPFCYSQFHLGECAILSAEKLDPKTQQPIVLYKAPQGLDRMWARIKIPDLSGMENFQARAYRQCPNQACQQPLPYNIANNENIVIGVVGPRAAGKSHYLTSLIYTLRERIQLSKIDCKEFMPLTGEVDKHYTDTYYTPLYVNKGTLGITDRADETTPYRPLVYTMTFEQYADPEPGSIQNGHARHLVSRRSINLVLFDVSGEQLQDEVEMTRFAPFFVHATGFILLVDPAAIPEFAEQLIPQLRPTSVGGSALSVIENLIRSIRRARGLADGWQIPVPAVFTLAKSDLLAYVLPEGRVHPLLRENYTKGFDLEDYLQRSSEIESLLIDLGVHTLLNKGEAFADSSFSAVSATGTYADDSGFFKFVNPIRCADPLLWLLWRIGVFNPTAQAAQTMAPVIIGGVQSRG